MKFVTIIIVAHSLYIPFKYINFFLQKESGFTFRNITIQLTEMKMGSVL